MSSSEVESVEINGTKLFFSMNPENDGKQIILYLHGGPGDACIPLTKKFNAELEEKFTFVNLEQRGCGLSYYPFRKEENLTIKVILEDIYLFVLYLLDRMKQDKLIIMGHSWGSVLGILFIQQYPELVSLYIGIGQVVNMQKNIQLQKDFLRENMKRTDVIDQLDFVNESVLSSLFLTKKIVAYGGSVFGAKNYRKLITPFLFSKDYTLKDLLHRLKGSNQSIHFFWEELLTIDFERITTFKVPLLFCEGRHDYHVSSKLVSDYVKTLKSQALIVWFEHSGHFPQWEEAAKFNRAINNLASDILK